MTTLSQPITFSPGLQAADASANAWLRQVTLRLRREICWRWHQQGYTTAAGTTTLPALEDRLRESLDLSRHWHDKCHFFATDVTARYLTEQIEAVSPMPGKSPQGSFGWVVEALALDDAAAFVLALALSPVFDAAAAPVIATCQNNLAATQPTLALAQMLWDRPGEILALADGSHPLWRYGLLSAVLEPLGWDTPLMVAPLIARQLLLTPAGLPDDVSLWSWGEAPLPSLSARAEVIAQRLRLAPTGLRIVPVQGAAGTLAQPMIQAITRVSQRPVLALSDRAVTSDEALKSLLTLAWLRGTDLYLPGHSAKTCGDDQSQGYRALQALAALPMTVFWRQGNGPPLAAFASGQVLPILELPRLDYCDRIQAWYQALGLQDVDVSPTLRQDIAACARRFRYEPQTIHRIAAGIPAMTNSGLTLTTACRAEMALDMGNLAQPVRPRFKAQELVLPPKQHRQFQEILQAMTALTQVHYQWGTARAWNECGISVLFAGPPGTGKTMAAEALAHQLDLPMYRIDLSQVVNKYIGETEKNLKRLFDTADMADTVLLFDEADALFGKRTEVKDAHDRYANLEISYLLERMERFQGLAILATNRQKDLDEAFLRRLRYIIEFPLPEERERRRLWQQVIPPQVDASQLDITFLARQFPLAGGHIRSIIFNACLQTAPAPSPTLAMETVLIAIKREYDKLNRSVSQTQFGPYAPLLERLDHAC